MRLVFYVGRFYDSSTGTMIPPRSRLRAEYQSRRNRGAVSLSRCCLSRNRRTESKSAPTIYAALARGTIYDAHFFPSGREITAYDVFTVIKFSKYSESSTSRDRISNIKKCTETAVDSGSSLKRGPMTPPRVISRSILRGSSRVWDMSRGIDDIHNREYMPTNASRKLPRAGIRLKALCPLSVNTANIYFVPRNARLIHYSEWRIVPGQLANGVTV